MCELFGLSARQKMNINRELKEFYSHAQDNPNGWGLYYNDGCSAFFKKNDVYRLCHDLLEIARKGLADRGLGEEKYLEPLFDRVKAQESPGAYMLRHLSEGADLEEVIKEYACI